MQTRMDADGASSRTHLEALFGFQQSLLAANKPDVPWDSAPTCVSCRHEHRTRHVTLGMPIGRLGSIVAKLQASATLNAVKIKTSRAARRVSFPDR